MTYRDMHPYFDNSFEHYPMVPMDMRSAFWNYMSYGISPGSFGVSVIVNDFYGASTRAHHALTTDSFRDIAKWMINNAPMNSYGSKEKYQTWKALTDDQRRDALIDSGLRPSVVDILKGAPA